VLLTRMHNEWTRHEEETARIAPLDYGINDTTYVYSYDFKHLEKRVEELFLWFSSGYKTFIAPYFPIVQSSGSGKTLLLHRLRNAINEKRKEIWGDIKCIILLCHKGNITRSGVHDLFDVTIVRWMIQVISCHKNRIKKYGII
jgi:hypothetical protein